MNKLMTAAVLVSAGRHPETGTPRACRGDAVAMALARAVAGEHVRVIHAGSAGEPALQDYLALGAQTVEVLQCAPEQDIIPSLAAALADTSLIFTGCRSELGEGSGLVPYMLAQRLDRAVVANVLDAEIKDGEAHVRQFLPKGKRRRVSVRLPAVLAIHPLAPVELKYAYARRVSGKVTELAQTTSAIVALPASTPPIWTIETAARRPAALKAPSQKSGHQRMLDAISAKSTAGIVANEGSDVGKAQVILKYLRENKLIDF